MLVGASAWAQAGDPPAGAGNNASAEAQRVTARADRLRRSVQKMLSDARNENDIIRVDCLNEKLTQINTHAMMAEQRQRNAEAAKDASKRDHELRVLAIIGQRLNHLESEARQCIGQEMFETGNTRVVTDIDPASVPFEDVPPDSPPSMRPAVNPGDVDNNVIISTPVSGTE